MASELWEALEALEKNVQLNKQRAEKIFALKEALDEARQENERFRRAANQVIAAFYFLDTDLTGEQERAVEGLLWAVTIAERERQADA